LQSLRIPIPQDFPSRYDALRSFLHKQGVNVVMDLEKSVLVVEGSPDRVVKIPDLVNLLLSGVNQKRVEKYFLSDEYYIKIDLRDTLKPKDMTRTLARIIGSNGSFKRKIEEITNADLIVKEGQILIIGSYASIEPARLAVEELILGKPQSVVLRNLKRRIAQNNWGK